MRRLIFLGFALPEESYRRVTSSDAVMTRQTQSFGWAVVNALCAAGLELDIISAAPTSNFPHNRALVVRGERFGDTAVQGRSVSFVNLLALKHVTRFATATAAIRAVAGRRKPEAIVVHGVHSPFIWVAVRAARRLHVPVVVILTDAPSIPNVLDGFASRSFKKLDLRLVRRGLRKVDGVIALTRGLADDYAPGVPALLFEGVAKRLPHATFSTSMSGSRKPVVVYAGGLAPNYGIEELLRSVTVSSGNWHLHICGDGALRDSVVEAARNSDRLTYHGLVPQEELVALYNSAALLISPRPSTANFVRHSFPSKLMEYMASGTPVMSTKLETIPADFSKYLNFCGDSAEEIGEAVDEFFRKPGPRADAAEFVLSSRGSVAQGRRLREFLSSLASERPDPTE